MKCKAACSGLSEQLVEALNRLRPEILLRVIGPHLHRPDMGSAGFYVQETDKADPLTHEPFCEVRLSGVSVTDDRCVQDFSNARQALETIYVQTIRAHLPSNQSVRLFVVLMLDGSPKPGMSPLLEGQEMVIKGL